MANRAQQTRLRIVEQREVCLPRGSVGTFGRNGPPRLTNRAGERIDLAVQCARRQQMPTVREMQRQLPDRVSVRAGFPNGDIGGDSIERFEHRRAVPGWAAVRFREAAENDFAARISDRFWQWSFR